MVKSFIAIFCFTILSCITNGQSIKTPPPSPAQTIRQDFGISYVELTYSRPGVKGRKVFGDLVPYGKVWRTGANAASHIKFGDDVVIGGQPVKAGEYVLYTIPGTDEWEIIINKGINNWGTEYKQDEDVVRFKVKPMKMEEPMETFTMQFANVKPNKMDLHIMWDKTAVSIPVIYDVDTKVMAQINDAMNKDNHPYYQAAMYYIESGKDLNQALTWLDKAIDQNPTAYWVYHQKANVLARLGKKDDARAAAQKSMELAKGEKNDEYVKMNEELLARLK